MYVICITSSVLAEAARINRLTSVDIYYIITNFFDSRSRFIFLLSKSGQNSLIPASYM